MAVYTQLSSDQVATFIADFGFVQLLNLKATSTGIENTNYFVSAIDKTGHTHTLVLTLFERMSPAELPYFVELTTFLANQGLPVPAPFRNQQGKALLSLGKRPALLVPCFSGQHPTEPNPEQCAAIAAKMASMHLSSPHFHHHRENDRGAHWREQAQHQLQPFLNREQKDLMLDQVSSWRLKQHAIDELPSGINHHDLFHDNALFEGNHVTGIIDFYNACDDVFIYDLAVLVNDWCSDEQGALKEAHYDAVMESYQSLRPLTEPELELWPHMLCHAALRFWISRLQSWHNNAAGKGVTQKDPYPMQHMLQLRVNALSK